MRQNRLMWCRYQAALDGFADNAISRGFRMRWGAMHVYRQRKLGLSAHYDKCWVLEDGIHMEPIETTTDNISGWQLSTWGQKSEPHAIAGHCWPLRPAV